MRTIATTVILILLLAPFSSAEKKVGVSDSQFNFGSVKQHATVIHDFWIHSLGDEPVRITKTIPGCGCTQIPITDSIIPPGDSVNLRIVFNTQAFLGSVSKIPKFATDADTTETRLKLYAQIETNPEKAVPLRISPPEADVSQFTDRVRRRGRVLILNHSDVDMTLNPVDTSARSFSIRLPETVPAGDTVEVFLVVHKDAIETDFKESFTFEAIGKDQRFRYTVPVVRMYKPDDR